MDVLVICSNCRKRLQLPDSLLNNWVKCSECNFTFVAQSAETDPTVQAEALAKRSPPELLPNPVSGRWSTGAALQLDDPRRSRRRPQKSGMQPVFVGLGIILAFGAAFAAFFLAKNGSLAGLFEGGGNDWREFESKDGLFRVQMPGRPKEDKQTSFTPAGGITAHMFSAKKDPAYLVAYADGPAALMQVNPEKLLDFAVQGGIAGMKGVGGAEGSRILKEKVIFLKGYSGRELHIEVPGKGQAICRCYLVKNRLYVQFVGGKHITPESEDALKFLDSFELTGTPAEPAGGGKQQPQGMFHNPMRPVAPVAPIRPPVQKPGQPSFKQQGGVLRK